MKNRWLLKLTFASTLALALATPASAQYGIPNVNINVNPGSTNVNVGGSSLDVSGTGGGAVVNVKNSAGQTVQINAQQGLGATISAQNLDQQAKLSIIGLDNGAEVMIKSDTDLEAYKNLVEEQCDAIRTISANGNTVEVAYKQPARFLGILKTSLNGNIEVDANSNVMVKLPWYSFLFAKDTAAIESKVKADLAVETKGVSVDIQRQAKTISVVTKAVSVNVTPCGVSVVNNNANNPDSQTNTNVNTNTSGSVNVSGSKNTSTQTQTNTNTGANTQTNTSASGSSGLNALVGTYTGTFSAYPGSDDSCVASGTTKFVVAANGVVTITTTGLGVTITGSGKVDASGNFSGSWSYAGQTSNYSGKFSGNTATGTYGNNFDCSGTWKVSR